MSTTEVGRNAESLVAAYLKSQKHKIISLNWRTRWCEIDVISKFNKTVYFTEVKYRSSDSWGDGFSYITKSKLKQMRFSAELWISEQNWSGECILQAASVDSQNQITFVEL